MSTSPAAGQRWRQPEIAPETAKIANRDGTVALLGARKWPKSVRDSWLETPGRRRQFFNKNAIFLTKFDRPIQTLFTRVFHGGETQPCVQEKTLQKHKGFFYRRAADTSKNAQILVFLIAEAAQVAQNTAPSGVLECSFFSREPKQAVTARENEP